MKVGDYVRIKNEAGWSCIGKLENINDFREYKYCVDIQAEDFIFVDDEMIYKSSPNIIDLIEVGDYVNGVRVDEIVYIGHGKSEDLEIAFRYKYAFEKDDVYTLKEEDIKSIVTKEQFSQMEYRIGG